MPCVLSKYTGIHAEGLWWAFPITKIFAALVPVCRFARGGWKRPA